MQTSGDQRRENAKLYPAVIASEAKQSMLRHKERMDCFASLATTWRGRGALDTRMRAYDDRDWVDAVALFLRSKISDRKARPAATRRRGVRIDHAERGADQIVDEIDFRAGEERH